jgi:hypothetical protein
LNEQVDEEDDQDAGHDGELIQRDELSAHALGRDFGDVERRDHGDSPDRDAAEQPRQDIGIQSPGKGGQDAGKGEEEGVDHDHRLAPEPVAERSARERSDHAADEHAGRRPAREPRGEVEVLLQKADRTRNDGRIVAEEQAAQSAYSGDQINVGGAAFGCIRSHKSFHHIK